jgi:hypothetical protein
MTAQHAFSRSLYLVVRGHFGDEHLASVYALVARQISQRPFTLSRRLTCAAYRKGLLAGLSLDSLEPIPACPYSNRLPNFLQGENSPISAWRCGFEDGGRIQAIVLRPETIPSPALLWAEYKLLSPDLQDAHNARESVRPQERAS